jgi:hypothetical protein
MGGGCGCNVAPCPQPILAVGSTDGVVKLWEQTTQADCDPKEVAGFSALPEIVTGDSGSGLVMQVRPLTCVMSDVQVHGALWRRATCARPLLFVDALCVMRGVESTMFVVC